MLWHNQRRLRGLVRPAPKSGAMAKTWEEVKTLILATTPEAGAIIYVDNTYELCIEDEEGKDEWRELRGRFGALLLDIGRQLYLEGAEPGLDQVGAFVKSGALRFRDLDDAF